MQQVDWRHLPAWTVSREEIASMGSQQEALKIIDQLLDLRGEKDVTTFSDGQKEQAEQYFKELTRINNAELAHIWPTFVFGEAAKSIQKVLRDLERRKKQGGITSVMESISPWVAYGSMEPKADNRLHYSVPFFEKQLEELAEAGVKNPLIIDLSSGIGADAEGFIRAGARNLVLNEFDQYLNQQGQRIGKLLGWEDSRNVNVNYRNYAWDQLPDKIKGARIAKGDIDGLIITNMGNSSGFIDDPSLKNLIEDTKKILVDFAIARYGSLEAGRHSVRSIFDGRIYNRTLEDSLEPEPLQFQNLHPGNNPTYPGKDVQAKATCAVDKDGRILARQHGFDSKNSVQGFRLNPGLDDLDSITYAYKTAEHFATLSMEVISISDFKTLLSQFFSEVRIHNDYAIDASPEHDREKGKVVQFVLIP